MIGELLYTSQQRRGSMDQQNSIAAAGPPGDQIASSFSDESSNQTDDSTLPSNQGEEKVELLAELLEEMRKELQEASKRIKILEKKMESMEKSKHRDGGEERVQPRPKTSTMNRRKGPGCAPTIPTSMTGCNPGSGDGNLCISDTRPTNTIVKSQPSASFQGAPSPTDPTLQPLVSLMPQTSETGQAVGGSNGQNKRVQLLPPAPAGRIFPQGARPKTSAMNRRRGPECALTTPTSMTGCHPGNGNGNLCISDPRPQGTIVQSQPSASFHGAPSPTDPTLQPLVSLMPQTSETGQAVGGSNGQNGNHQIAPAVAVPSSSPTSAISSLDPGMLQAFKSFMSQYCDSSGCSRLTLDHVSQTHYQKSVVARDDAGQWHVAHSYGEVGGQTVPSFTEFFNCTSNSAVVPSLGRDVSNCPPNNVLTEVHMYELSTMIGTNWRRIGVQCLKFSYDNLSTIKANNPEVENTVFEMFRQWKWKNGSSGGGTISHLMAVLSESGLVDPGVIQYLKSLRE